MRDLLRGYATAILESAATAGRARSRSRMIWARFRGPSPSLTRSATCSRMGPYRPGHVAVSCTISWMQRPQPSLRLSFPGQHLWSLLAEFPVAVLALVELALETADAADAGQVRTVPAEELLGGRTAVRERIRGYADRLFQEVDRLELIDDIEDELVRFARILDSSRGLRHALGDPSTAVAQRVALVGDLLRGKVLVATARLVAYVLQAGHIRDLVGTLEWVAGLAAEERGGASPRCARRSSSMMTSTSGSSRRSSARRVVRSKFACRSSPRCWAGWRSRSAIPSSTARCGTVSTSSAKPWPRRRPCETCRLSSMTVPEPRRRGQRTPTDA